jgi:hypothetical protein
MAASAERARADDLQTKKGAADVRSGRAIA